jgi:hypothetical protein
MPLYVVLTRLLGRERNSEDLPGSVIEMDEDDALELVALGALEAAPDDAVATDASDPIKAALGALNVKELQFFANSNGLSLGKATKKPDIVDILAEPVDRDDADEVTAFLERVAGVREAFKASQ